MVDLPSGGNPPRADSAATRPISNDQDTPLMAAAPDVERRVFQLGEVITGRYRVERFLGKGGMGEVYEVEDGRLNERFALKTLLPELQSNPEYVQRFRREVRTALKVTHPNVCRIHPISDDATFFTMELLNGDPLSDVLRRGPIASEVAYPILRDILDGLTAIHAEGILHRDLKPSNVIVVPGSTRLLAKITDFGLARAWVSIDTPITKQGEAQGTLLYMAPELLKGGVASPASDIWALGMIMYELLAGLHPFRHLSTVAALQAALFAGDIAAPRTHAPNLSEHVESVILRCLSLDPGTRYADPREVLQTLALQAPVGGAGQASVQPAEETIPPELKRLLDDADLAVHEGRYADARVVLLNVLDTAAPESRAHVAARMDLAEVDLLEGSNTAAARDALLACLQLVPRDDRKRRRIALSLLGDAEALLGNVSAAHALFLEARQLAHEIEDRFAEAATLVGLSRTEELRGDLAVAERLIDEAIGLFRAEYRDATPDHAREKRVAAINLAAALSTRGHLLTHAGRLTEALVALEAALPLFRETASTDNIGGTLLMKAEILLTEAKWQDGFELLEEAATLFDSIGNAPWEARCLRHMSRLFENTGEVAAARAFLAHAIRKLSREPWAPQERIPYLLELMRFEQRHDSEERASALLDEAKSLARDKEHEGLLAECILAEASLLHGEEKKPERAALFDAAAQDIEAALAHTEVRGRRAVLMQRLGSLCGYRENVRQARLWFERALHEFEAIGDVSGVARCMSAIAGAARIDHAPSEAAAVLERIIEFTKTLPLYHERAAALHDLARLRLSLYNDVAAARRYLDDAQALVEEYGLRDLKNGIRQLSEVVEHAERLDQPHDRDLAALVAELQAWCDRFPSDRDAIVPLWYYLHRTDLWAITRAMLGIKFLIRCEQRDAFDTTAAALLSQGDLFVFGPSFALQQQPQTELIPCGHDLLFPPHLSVAFLKRNDGDEESAPDPSAIAQAYVKLLRDQAYIGVPFEDAPAGPGLSILGRHLRLPQAISDLMLDPSMLSKKQVCLPVGSGSIVLDGREEKPPSLHHVMIGAWENGFMPLFLEQLPDVGDVKVVASTPVTIGCVTADRAGATKNEWMRLLNDCPVTPREALQRFRDYWAELNATLGSELGIRMTAYALRFRVGAVQTTYAAVVLRIGAL
jgi:tRNA A-37 threonylcarbamoyl transferase component Bud32/tetratricopeptide (TPR) repeat protein